VPALSRIISVLAAGSSEAARIGSASVTGLAAAVATFARRPIPIRLLPDANGHDRSDTAQLERVLLIRLFQQTTICCDQASSRSLSMSRPPWMRR